MLGPTTATVDGVIVSPHFLSGDSLAERTPPRPVVQLGSAPTPLRDCVVMGERAGSEAMTRHLLESGRRRIALVWNNAPGTAPQGDRFEGYLAALAAYGVPRDDALFVSGSDWDRRASGYEAMVGLLRQKVAFDAALCVNDAIAVGLCGRCTASGAASRPTWCCAHRRCRPDSTARTAARSKFCLVLDNAEVSCQHHRGL